MTSRPANEPKTAFNEDDLRKWVAALMGSRPNAPTKAESVAAPDVTSLSGGARPVGVTVRMNLDNGDMVTVNLNPVIAKSLIDAVMQAGEDMGGLHKDGRVTFPIL